MRFSLRVTLLTLLLAIIGFTVFGVALTFYFHANFLADDLSQQLQVQTEQRIKSEIENLLRQATSLSETVAKRVTEGKLKVNDFDGFVRFSRDAMAITPGLSGFYLGEESTGESIGVSHLREKTSIWESKREGSKPGFRVSEYWADDYPKKPFKHDADDLAPDIRLRPWYQLARDNQRPSWTDVFVFLGVDNVRNVHGLSYCTPLLSKEGKLEGVLTADFELRDLCNFLKEINFGKAGFSFVLGRQADGSRRVIAHPNADILMKQIQTNVGKVPNLIAPEEFPDPIVAAFIKQLDLVEVDLMKTSGSPITFEVGGKSYLGAVRAMTSEANPKWSIFTVIPEAEVFGQIGRSVRLTIWITVGVMLASLALSFLVAGQVSRPLEKLADEAKEIQHLQFPKVAPIHSMVREVDDLATAIEDMKTGLRSFGKYIPQGLLRSFISSGQEAKFGGARKEVSIFFSDIVDFTSISESLDPEQIVELLRIYLNTVCLEIQNTGGTVDKYIGDAVMAFWDVPTNLQGFNHATAACLAALAVQEALDTLNAKWQSEGKSPFHTRIGLNTGDVVVGNIGSDARFNYTIIGDAVNLSSRLEGLNKNYGTRIMLSEATYRQAADLVVARPLDHVGVKGRKGGVPVYELMGLKQNVSDQDLEIAELSSRGLLKYLERDWAAAIHQFETIKSLKPNDQPAQVLIERCVLFASNPPGPDWDGVNRLTHK
jgi:adenylate cyclase